MRRWGEDCFEEVSWAIPIAMISFVPEELGVSLLKTALYGWCVESRFGRHRRPCLYGCSGGGIRELQYLVCSGEEVVRAVVLTYSLVAPCMERLLLVLRRDGTLRLRILLVFDSLLFAFDARRHGSFATTRKLVLTRLKELRRCHLVVRELILRVPA